MQLSFGWILFHELSYESNLLVNLVGYMSCDLYNSKLVRFFVLENEAGFFFHYLKTPINGIMYFFYKD